MTDNHPSQVHGASQKDTSPGEGPSFGTGSSGTSKKTTDQQTEQEVPSELTGFAHFWKDLVRLGFGETALRIGTSVLSISLFLLVVWIMGNFYLRAQADNGSIQPQTAAAFAAPAREESPTPTAIPAVVAPEFTLPEGAAALQGVTRLAKLHTTIPTRPRNEIATYVVEKGDTLFGIAEKFNLKPETILWGNRFTLGDDPHTIRPGQELVILPVDGVYHKWSAGEGLNGVAKFYGVTPEDIINYPGNNLTVEKVGDFAHPTIEAGTLLVVPGGHGVFSDWKTPRITRTNTSDASALGAGFCKTVAGGFIGSSTFIWPSTERYISGFHFQPEINHWGIDIGGATGNSIFAADTGVIVYAGWSDYGYGNMIVIDHGNGWQTLYAHLSVLNVSCGQGVAGGATIGAMGSTGNSSGPHLHFEMRSDKYVRVNPLDFLK
jgi:murein DD-endopeptidase MepM/ murein hydrolase activator NlpD